jgi:hypothetical protein
MTNTVMRSEREIVAMRDALERRTLQPFGCSELGKAALAALRWACDHTIGDREVLDLADHVGDDDDEC